MTETHDRNGHTEGPLEGDILTGREVALVKARQKTVKARFWSKFRAVVGRLPFARDLLAAYYCAFDPQTPIRVRATLLGALVYFIMPIDALPDAIAFLGFTDDAAVLMAAIRAVSGAIRPAHYNRADDALKNDQADPLV